MANVRLTAIIGLLLTNAILAAVHSSSFAYFNAIRAVLRTDASIVQPNGMTIFLASIPANSVLYHGTDQKHAVKGFEWLAFEPDFAYWFAQPPRTRPSACSTCKQHIFEQGKTQYGYLHTYETRQNLRLILLDGLSAFKRSTGTQDMQDVLLLNRSIQCDENMSCERGRADALCRLSEERWNGRIGGFIRKDPQWEVILCSFERQLRLQDVMSVVENHRSPPRHYKDEDRRPGWSWDSNDLPNQDRDDVVVQSTVHVDFDRSVSMFDFDSTLATQKLPRLLNLTSANREAFMRHLDATILASPGEINLQRKADALAMRYSPILERARSGNLTTLPEIKQALKEVLQPYLNAQSEELQVSSGRCARPYAVPNNASPSAKAIHIVAQYVCRSLLEVNATDDFHQAMQSLQDVRKRLRWFSH